VREEGWAVAYRHYKAVEEKQMSREQRRGSVMDKFVINPNDTTEASDMVMKKTWNELPNLQ
jgi:hypothetical protein